MTNGRTKCPWLVVIKGDIGFSMVNQFKMDPGDVAPCLQRPAGQMLPIRLSER